MTTAPASTYAITRRPTPVERRGAGIQNILRTRLVRGRDMAGNTVTVCPFFTEDGIDATATEIRGLAGLGRTDRWKAVIEAWAGMVEEAHTLPHTLVWAIQQGSVYAAHAVE